MKKLKLNKETVANLNNVQIERIRGGGTVLPVCESGMSQQDPKCYTDCVIYCVFSTTPECQSAIC